MLNACEVVWHIALFQKAKTEKVTNIVKSKHLKLITVLLPKFKIEEKFLT